MLRQALGIGCTLPGAGSFGSNTENGVSLKVVATAGHQPGDSSETKAAENCDTDLRDDVDARSQLNRGNRMNSEVWTRKRACRW